MADKLFRFSATLQINSRAKGFVKKAPGATEESMRRVLKYAKKDAQDRVAPGKGPGPHPHNWPHVDKGDKDGLMTSVKDAIWLQGFLTEGTIYTDSAYGTYLEVGWRTKAKNFYRYPWLKPAFLGALKYLPKLAAETFRSQMQNFPEDEIVKDAQLESWAGAAERWAKDMKALEAQAKTKQPEIPPAYKSHISPHARRPLAKGIPRGRPKENIDLGLEMKLDRERVGRERKHEAEAERAGKLDIKALRRTRRSSEAERRSEIDPIKAAQQYERERERMQSIRDKRRKATHEAQDQAIQAANAKLKKATQPNIKAPKAPKVPKVPSVKRPRKKKS